MSDAINQAKDVLGVDDSDDTKRRKLAEKPDSEMTDRENIEQGELEEVKEQEDQASREDEKRGE